MNWDDTDIRNAKNLLRAVNKATYNDMLGAEVLAFAVCVKWLKDLIEIMENPPAKKTPVRTKKNASTRKK